MTGEEAAYLWLSITPGIGPKHRQALLDRWDNALAVWEAGQSAWAEQVGERLAAALAQSHQPDRLREALRACKRAGCRVVTRASPAYPKRLLGIPDAPAVLYCRGDVALCNLNCVAVVGTRRNTRYGAEVARQFARELAANGVCVVSGLAYGIDSYAHRGALEADGNTIAVLGCGVDRAYPAEHQQLQERIAQTGLLVSEYPPGTRPHPSHFPARNRIIAGLSLGTVVVEAPVGSGALITAEYAVDYGRELFTVPGPVTSKVSEATNLLLYTTAQIALSGGDILAALGLQSGAMQEENNGYNGLTYEQKSVVQALQNEDLTVDELLQATALDVGKLNSLLTMLEMGGIIKQSPGRHYGLKR